MENSSVCWYCDGTADDPYNDDCWCPNCKGSGKEPKMDPENPAVKHASRVISEIIWRYVQTHSSEECQELKRKIEADRAAEERLFGRPRIVAPPLRKTKNEPDPSPNEEPY